MKKRLKLKSQLHIENLIQSNMMQIVLARVWLLQKMPELFDKYERIQIKG